MLVRTEYSFRQAFGSAEAALACLPDGGIIADDGAWGHVPWAKAGRVSGKPVGFGARLRVSAEREGRDNWRELIVVAVSAAGLRDLYGLITLSWAQKHWWPRLRPEQIGPSDGWVVLASGHRHGDAPPLEPWMLVPWVPGLLRGNGPAFSDNYYPRVVDREAWAYALGGKAHTGVAPAHILSPVELRAEGAPDRCLGAGRDLVAAASSVGLPRATNIRFPVPDAQRALQDKCLAELFARGLGTNYRNRLFRELELIAEKGFADYFLVIAEMIAWAKERMLVGPGRGSSAGSIVCWLLRITEIDPLAHGLLFERFVDTNRADLPDIDIDFPDEGREAVLNHLAEQYGAAQVAHIGTVMRYKPRSALDDVAKALRVPLWRLDAVKDGIIERSSGDSRVNDCLADTLNGLEAGRQLLAEFPQIEVATRLEGAARQSGKHAAGMIVCNEPVEHFCAVGEGRVAQIDKKSAEALNMLKIDALGLRTLSVLQAACEQAGIDRNQLYAVPLEDPAVFAVLNARRYAGIFQLEGHALQSLAGQFQVRCFADIAALTALARPGPLGSGAATRWIERHEGRAEARAAHPALTELTAETYGEILYQEQVMMVTRELGRFSWADTAAIRKLMSNRVGDEAFGRFEEKFMAGCAANGVEQKDAEAIWKAINSFGSWAFNKSHAVAYGLLSYWCAWLKAYHPLAFAAGCLQHARDADSARLLLRELKREGVAWVPLSEQSVEDWSVVDGVLTGGLLGVKGIGPVMAREIITRRRNGMALTERMSKLLASESAWAPERVNPTETLFGHLYKKSPFSMRVLTIEQSRTLGETCIVIGRLIKKTTRDVNEDVMKARRGGGELSGPQKFLIFFIEDDTGRKLCRIDRFRYAEIGVPIVERGVVGETWLAVRGRVPTEFDIMYVEKLQWLK